MDGLLSFLGNMANNVSSRISSLGSTFAALMAHGWKGLKKSYQSMSDAVTGANLTGAQREANAFEAQQAQNQMDFQERMSNTEYQRGVADMKAAGLNPALMYGNGANGASSPSGSMAGSEAPGTPDVVGFMTALSNLSLLKAQRDNIRSQTREREQNVRESEERINQIRATTEKLVSDTNVNIANLRKIGLEGDALEIANDYLVDEKETALEIMALQKDEIDANVREINARISKLSADERLVLQQIAESSRRVNLLLAQERLTDAQRGEVYQTIENIKESRNNLKKQGKILDKDINWYVHDKIAGDISEVGRIASGILGIGKIGKLFGKSKTSKVVGANPYDEYADYLN